MHPKNITVIKASGDKEPFNEEKVRRSIRRARVPKKLENEVVNHIRKIVYDGIPTQEIYKHIREFLGKSVSPYTKSLYGLKQAIMQLGPSGFPFEKFVSQVLEYHGFETEVDVIVSGKCVDHEVDVLARKDNRQYMMECKFHTTPGTRSDVKVALYVQARFEDIQANTGSQLREKVLISQPWLVTNTKFTTEAIEYGNCVGMKVMGWNHPETGDLRGLIESVGLHPITCLTTLTHEQIKYLLDKGIVLCRQLVSDKDSLEEAGVSKETIEQALKEISLIIGKIAD